MVNESGNSSIAFAESRGEAAPEKTGAIPETMVSERSIKFHADSASDGENDPDTTTSVSIRIESENPLTANSHNPRATQNVAQDSVSPTHDIHTESQDEIHFETNEEVAPSSVQSVRFQVEESHGDSKLNRGASPPPIEEVEEAHVITQDATEGESVVDFVEETPQPAHNSTQPPHAPAATAAEVHEDVEVVEEEEAQPPTQAKRSTAGAMESAPAAAVAAPAVDAVAPAAPEADEAGLATYPPPRRVAPRAATAARTPRANGPLPTTPRSRSPNSSYRPPQQQQQQQTEVRAPSPAGVPPLAPADESTQVERAAASAAAARPQNFARHPTGNSEFSSVADADAEAAVATVTTPASPNIVVTNHMRVFADAAWAAVVNTSRDTIERTVSNETAAAAGVEAQFVRVTSIEADATGMTCEMSIGHAPGQATEEIDEAIQACTYPNTQLLLDIAAGHEGTAAGAAAAAPAAVENDDAERQAPPMAFSFNETVGEGLLRISYSVFPFGSYRHLELSFDGPMDAITIKFVKCCLSEYLGMHESQLVVRRGEEVLLDDATGADLGLANGCTLEAQCTISQREETEDVEDSLQASRQGAVASRNAEEHQEVEEDVETEVAAAAAPAAHEPKAAADADVKEEEEPHAAEEPQQTAPVPTPAPQPKAKKAKKAAKVEADAPAKKKKTAAAPAEASKEAPKKKKATAVAKDAAPADKKKKTSKAKAVTKAAPQQQQPRSTASPAAGTANPHYASPTRSTGRAATPQASAPRSRVVKTPLPRMLTTPRVYHSHSVRPGADSLEEGETMATYMSASRSPSHDGAMARASAGRRSSTPAPVGSEAGGQSVGRRSASAAPAPAAPAPSTPSHNASSIVVTRRRSSGESRALSATAPASQSSAPLPAQHTIRGVTSVGVRPRPVIHAYPHNSVEHQAETHAASVHTHTIQVTQLQHQQQHDDDADSVDYVEEVVMVVTEEEEDTVVVMRDDDVVMQAQVYTQKEALVYAEVPQPRAAIEEEEQQEQQDQQQQQQQDDDDDDDVNFVEEGSLEYEYSPEPEPQQHQEEDPVPAAAPNPFV